MPGRTLLDGDEGEVVVTAASLREGARGFEAEGDGRIGYYFLFTHA